ncbi:MAG: EAL domain-containing protein, partial [Pseudomonas sp.]
MTSKIEIPKPCKDCQENTPLCFEFTMAFQPIVDIRDRSVFAYEALIRGTDGAGAASMLAKVNEENRYIFDQSS